MQLDPVHLFDEPNESVSGLMLALDFYFVQEQIGQVASEPGQTCMSASSSGGLVFIVQTRFAAVGRGKV